MISIGITIIRQFFSRNIVDRLVIYFFLTELVRKVVFGLILMEDPYYSPRFSQYLFFTFILLDYLISYKELVNLKVTINVVSLFLLFFLFVVFHGVYVGILSGNSAFEVFNDSVPLLLLVVNGFRMQSLNAPSASIDFQYLLKSCTSLIAMISLVGVVSGLLGAPVTGTTGTIPTAIYVSLAFAAFLTGQRLSVIYYLVPLAIIGVSFQDLNRSTFFFVVLSTGLLVAMSFLKSPIKAIAGLLVVSIFAGIGWVSLPEDSKLYRRIVGLQNIDFSASTGSIGERSEEYRRIGQKLELKGQTSVWFGLGHGGVYNMRTTHEYVKNYGHAHYSWALFKLRYGQLGFIYLFVIASVMLWQIKRNWSLVDPEKMFIALFCLQASVYLLTYVNFIFLTSGLVFFYSVTQQKRLR